MKGKPNIINGCKSCKSMTEESSNEKTISPEKLLIDNPSDFRFHAAYLTYADVYDKVTSSEARSS